MKKGCTDIPVITRARGYRLYTDRGKRLVDLWQYGGRALLGHTPPGLLRTLKNGAERGLLVPLPHFASQRFLKALAALFPGFSFRVYRDEGVLRRALETAGFSGENSAPFWRPFSGEAVPVSSFVPVLPFPFPGAPEVLAFDSSRETPGFPPSETLAPAALLGASRCVWDLIALLASGKRAAPFPLLAGALRENPGWKRRGIYLRYSGDKDYTCIFSRFLEEGFLLPPSPEEDAILPGELSPGEEKKLAGLLLRP